MGESIQILRKEVTIDTLDLVSNFRRHPQVVLNHQLGQRGTIHKHNLCGMLLLGIIVRSCGKPGSRNKQALGRPLSRQCANELLDFRPPDRLLAIPVLRLNINQVKAQLILTDNSINSLISRLSDNDPGIFN